MSGPRLARIRRRNNRLLEVEPCLALFLALSNLRPQQGLEAGARCREPIASLGSTMIDSSRLAIALEMPILKYPR